MSVSDCHSDPPSFSPQGHDLGMRSLEGLIAF